MCARRRRDEVGERTVEADLSSRISRMEVSDAGRRVGFRS
jgi:hypothetical protein